jgi:hypothetical protein
MALHRTGARAEGESRMTNSSATGLRAETDHSLRALRVGIRAQHP